MNGKRTLDAWLTSAARKSPVPAAPAAEEKAAAPGLRTPLTDCAVDAPAKSRLDPLEHPPSRSGADVPHRHQSLRTCVIACVGWEGAKDEARDLRDEIVSAGGTLVQAEAVEPGACTHILVGPARGGGAPDEPHLLRAVAAGARLVDAAWVTRACLSGAQAPPPGARIGPPGGSVGASSSAGMGGGAVPADASDVDPGPPAGEPMDPMEEDELETVAVLPSGQGEGSHAGEDGEDWSGVPPLPAEYVDAWDREHVRLPCSPRARCLDGAPLWPILYRALHPPPTDAETLLRSLRTIRKAVGGRWGLERIKELVYTVMSQSQRDVFFGRILPELCSLVLRTPELFPSPLPLLRSGAPRTVSLVADQCACLVANAFFCTLPFRNDVPRAAGARATGLPYFSFCWLLGELPAPRFDRSGPRLSSQHRAKWLCLLIYMERIAERQRGAHAAEWGGRRVCFSRLVADTSELELSGSWVGCGAPVCHVSASAVGTIEDAGPAALQVDFANATVGGGVLRNGCVQEEIRFLICPELIVSRLLAETMADNEALVMRGFERFSSYTGYAASFACAGRYDDGALPDGSSRPPSEPLLTSLVAIDATPYGRDMHARLGQYGHGIERELNKAFVGFGPSETAGGDGAEHASLEVCTGNWGCGAFGGCLQLKAVIQMLAASRAHRPAIRYCTFGDQQLARGINGLAERMGAARLRTGQLVQLLLRFRPAKWPADMSGACANLFGYLGQALDHALRADRLQRSSLPPSAHHATRPVCGGATVGRSCGSDTEEDMPDEPDRSVDDPATDAGNGRAVAARQGEAEARTAGEDSLELQDGGLDGGPGSVDDDSEQSWLENLHGALVHGLPSAGMEEAGLQGPALEPPGLAVNDSEETQVDVPCEAEAASARLPVGLGADRPGLGLVVAPSSDDPEMDLLPDAVAPMLDDTRDVDVDNTRGVDGGKAAVRTDWTATGGGLDGPAQPSAAADPLNDAIGSRAWGVAAETGEGGTGAGL